MGKYDDAMYRYLKDNARFADLFNAAAFDGKEVLKPEMLEADDGRYVITKRKRNGKIQSGNWYRDIKKRTKDGRFLAVTAIENQEVIDYTMPLRMMQYDEMEYEEQLRRIRKQKEGALKEKGQVPNKWNTDIDSNDKLQPVYSICLYHGTKSWNGPRSLKDMMNFEGADKEWESLFHDYGMSLFCANEVMDYSVFRTELKQLLQVIPYRKDKAGLNNILHKAEYMNLDRETAETIAILTDTTELIERLDEFEAEGGYDMCQAMDELRADWKAEGKAEGRADGILSSIQNIMTSMKLSAEQAMDALLVPEEDREKYLEKL